MTLGNGETCKDYPDRCGRCGGTGKHYYDCPYENGYYIENMAVFRASFKTKEMKNNEPV